MRRINRAATGLLALSFVLLGGCALMPPAEEAAPAAGASATPAALESSASKESVDSTERAAAPAATAPLAPAVAAQPQAPALPPAAAPEPTAAPESSAAAAPENAARPGAVTTPPREFPASLTPPTPDGERAVGTLCRELGGKLGSVSVADCEAQKLRVDGHYSVNGRALAQRDFAPRSAQGEAIRVLVLGGIHGDEYSSFSIMFKWMDLLAGDPSEGIHWRFLPAVNPDGLLDGEAVRQNANGVDLNRNFPSRDWPAKAHKYWHAEAGKSPRRFPGEGPGSEPEVRWVVEQIERYRPQVIVSVHAPYHLLDFDGPSKAPEKIGELYLHQLGVYPGSLGNYGGIDLAIPVVTLELPHAGIMPSNAQIHAMWNDLVDWVSRRAPANGAS